MAQSQRQTGFNRVYSDSPPPRKPYYSTQEPLDVRNLEVNQLKSEEEAVSLLQQQVAQVQQMKLENDRKESIIQDLRQQITELLRFKEQAFNMKAQIALQEERSKLRETESSFKISELQERITQLESNESILQHEIGRLEEVKNRSDEAKNHLSQQLRRQQHDHESSLRSELERWEIAKSRLEQELRVAHETVESQRETISKLNGQVRSLKESSEVLAHVEMERSILLQEKEELQRGVGELQNQVNRLQDQLIRLSREAALADEYRKELEGMASLENEIRSSVASHAELKEQLRQQRGIAKEFEDEKKKWKDLFHDTDKRLKDITLQFEAKSADYEHKISTLQSVEEEVIEKRRQVDLLTEELSRQRSTEIQLTNELSLLQNQHSQSCYILDIVSTEVPQELSSLYRILERVKSGSHIEAIEAPFPLSAALGQLRVILQTLRTRIVDISAEFSALRDHSKLTESVIETSKANIAELEAESKQLKEERDKISSELTREQESRMLLEQSLESTKIQIQESNDTIDHLRTESKNRSDFLILLLGILSKSKVLNTDSIEHSQYPDVSSWSILQVVMREQVGQLVSKSDNLSLQVAELRSEIKRRDDLHRDLARQLEKSHEQAREMQETLHIKHAEQIAEISQESDEIAENLRRHIRESDLQISSLQHATEELSRVVQEGSEKLLLSQKHVHSLHQAFLLVLRGLRSADARIRDLIVQKRILSQKLISADKLKRDVVELSEAMMGEFKTANTNAPPQRQVFTFRVVAIFVLASLRLQNMTQSRLYGEWVNCGSERVQLCSKSDLKIYEDDPSQIVDTMFSITSSSDSDAKMLSKIRSKLEPSFGQGEKYLSRSLLFWIHRQHHRGSRSSKQTVSEKAVSIIRKKTLQISKAIKEGEKDRTRLESTLSALQQQNAELLQKLHENEHQITQQSELLEYYASRLEELQSELTLYIPPEKYEELLNAHQALMQSYKDVMKQKEQAQARLDTNNTDMEKLKQTLQKCELENRDREQEIAKLKRQLGEREQDLANAQEIFRQKNTPICDFGGFQETAER
eukprot:TRINITY_DN4575_c0_g1_i1.p1 TRINITY_DN4575_c0_g1~~TRINITY_DN4575_c0_g1_i1.p1  ORF type:complete len:1048 (+),score=233.43 TRINITY_DN4575_c0_g1_i1:117-3260(+)